MAVKGAGLDNPHEPQIPLTIIPGLQNELFDVDAALVETPNPDRQPRLPGLCDGLLSLFTPDGEIETAFPDSHQRTFITHGAATAPHGS